MNENDPCIRVWQSRLGSVGKRALKVFTKFYDEVLSSDEVLAGLEPARIVEWQANAVGRERFRILGLAQAWVDKQPKLRHSSQVTYLSWIRSFFMHNHASLPEDRSFHFKSEVPPVEGELSPEAFRRIVLNSNLMYRAIFLFMAATLVDEKGLVHINLNYSPLIVDALTKNAGVVKLVLPGRKKYRNVKSFYTLFSTKGDVADALRDYLKSTPHDLKGPLFLNSHGQPISETNIRRYFLRRAVEAGLVTPKIPVCLKCGGETVKAVKRYVDEAKRKKRRVAYVCREYGHVNWACEVNVNLKGNRYGVNPHEIRDLMASRWRESGAKTVVREFLMGHLKQVDPNEYDKLKYTPQDAIVEYRKFLPYANILSQDPNKVDRSEIDSKLEARDAEVEVLRREVATLKRLERHLPLLLKLAKDHEKRLDKE